MNKKGALLLLLCHLIWGFQPLFWRLLNGFDSLTTLSMRIIWSAIFTVSLLLFTKRINALWAIFRDWQKLKYLIPATIVIAADWGLFVYAVKAGHVLDTSLGYFMSPLVTMVLSVLIFKEKLCKLQLTAIGLAVTGVIISAVQYGSIPVISIMLALVSVYACFKKLANVDPLISIAAETLMMLPFAMVYMLFFEDLGAYDLSGHALFALSGIITAVPMTLYAAGINSLPFLMVGFSQYLSPSLGLLSGLLMGERISRERLVTFLFVWAGIAVYMFHIYRTESRAKVLSRETEIKATPPTSPQGS